LSLTVRPIVGRRAKITALGAYVPPDTITNQDLEKMVETSDQWIMERTGIKTRHKLAAGLGVSDMCTEAAKKVLAMRGIAASEIECILVGTVTPDMMFPSTACLVQHKIGATGAWGFDVSGGCSGFVFALQAGVKLIESGAHKKVLVCGADANTRMTDYTDRTTCVLFGDGGGAAVIGPSNRPGVGILGAKLGAYGEGVDLLYMSPGGSSNPITPETAANGGPTVKMKGKEVFKLAVRAMDEAARDILEQHHFTADHIALVIPHQANLRIIEAISQYLELPMERFFVNLDRYGNTSAASIPIALDEARRAGRIKPGDLTLLVAFGAGLTYASALIRW